MSRHRIASDPGCKTAVLSHSSELEQVEKMNMSPTGTRPARSLEGHSPGRDACKLDPRRGSTGIRIGKEIGKALASGIRSIFKNMAVAMHALVSTMLCCQNQLELESMDFEVLGVRIQLFCVCHGVCISS
jgi:hypothetical protein